MLFRIGYYALISFVTWTFGVELGRNNSFYLLLTEYHSTTPHNDQLNHSFLFILMFLKHVKFCSRRILSWHLPCDGGRWRRLQVPGGSREWWRGSHNIPGGQLICINPPRVPKNNPGEPPANHRRSRDWGGVCVNQRKTCCWGAYY